MDNSKVVDVEIEKQHADEVQGSSYGTPGLSINVTYVKATIALIVAGVKRLQPKGLVDPLIREDNVTYLIDEEMRAVQRESKSDILHWVIQPNIKRDPLNPLLRCEPDFVFMWDDEEIDPDIGLYAEAKRLFGTGSSLADKYVDEGLLDFVEGRYGRGHNFGIMLGYVLTGPLDTAVSRVKRAMSVRKTKTAQHTEFTPNNTISFHPATHHSSHIQKGASTSMTIVHVFLDFS